MGSGAFQAAVFARFEILPGITGLWQVKGRNRLSMQEALELDLEYVKRRSVRLYVAILLQTIPAVLFNRECRVTWAEHARRWPWRIRSRATAAGSQPLSAGVVLD